MAVELSEEVKNALRDPGSVKVLASVDRDGRPYVVAKGSLSVDEEGRLYYLELLESSATNKNLIRSLWYDQWVAVNVITKDGRSYQIRGVPVKTLVAGRIYEAYYQKVQSQNPQNDLAAVYYIEPEEIREQTYQLRKEQEERKHPLYIHLDRLAAKQ